MTNPYQAPAASLEPSRSSQIERLAVSDTWKQRFFLIERAGGVKLPRFKSLAFKERMNIGFNVLAFFLGPFYYLAKGLWRQALVLMAVGTSIIGVMLAFGMDDLTRGVGYGVAPAFAARANIGYYSKQVLGRALWF